MRRLGDKPLTGAEKQKRHREKVKARLAEAVALKSVYLGSSGKMPGLTECYATLLHDLGASADEAEILTASIACLQDEFAALLRERGRAALEALRMRKKRSGGSLMARLTAVASAENS